VHGDSDMGKRWELLPTPYATGDAAMTLGCMKFKTRAYIEKHNQLRAELVSDRMRPEPRKGCSPQRELSDHSPVRRWWNSGALA
jgi:hypothetical protein